MKSLKETNKEHGILTFKGSILTKGFRKMLSEQGVERYTMNTSDWTGVYLSRILSDDENLYHFVFQPAI